jgi:hypothetical protein
MTMVTILPLLAAVPKRFWTRRDDAAVTVTTVSLGGFAILVAYYDRGTPAL